MGFSEIERWEQGIKIHRQGAGAPRIKTYHGLIALLEGSNEMQQREICTLGVRGYHQSISKRLDHGLDYTLLSLSVFTIQMAPNGTKKPTTVTTINRCPSSA